MSLAIYSLLEPLNLYDLQKGGLIDAELQAYTAALSLIEQKLLHIITQAYVQTATGNSLLQHEKLVGLQERSAMDLGDRRKLVIYRLSTSPFDFSLEGMHGSVRAAGMDAEITENPTDESLQIVSKRLIDDFVDLDAVKASVNSMLPAHLTAEYDIGIMTWDIFEDFNVNWDSWDALNFKWSEFDIDGHTIFANGGG